MKAHRLALTLLFFSPFLSSLYIEANNKGEVLRENQTLKWVDEVVLPSSASKNKESKKPYGLMIDLVSSPSVLYQHGYPVKTSMESLLDEDFKNYQYAAIRSSKPTFGWIVPSQGEGTRQTSYRILVSDSKEDILAKKGNVWDSDIQKSSQSVSVGYGGTPLQADKTYFWRVCITTNKKEKENWSAVETFRTASELKPYAVSYQPQVRVADYPEFIRAIDSENTFIDFGKASYGSLELTLYSAAVDTIYVAIGEDAKNGRLNSKPGGTVRYYRYPLVLQPGTHTYPVIPAGEKNRDSSPNVIHVPEYLNQVAPFRYCEIADYTGKVTPEQVLRHTMIYPFDDHNSHFHCSDEVLNRIWDLCKYTIKATSAFGLYVDGDRERLPYEADAIINQLGHYTTDREYAMGRHTLEHLLYHPTWPTEWILQALIIAWNDYMYTGDIRSIAEHYELLKERTLISSTCQNGLISTRANPTVNTEDFQKRIHFKGEIRDIVDWPRPTEDDHYDYSDYNTVVNAYHNYALYLLEQMAELTGRVSEAKELRARREKHYQVFQQSFFDTERKVYVDGLNSSHASLHANMFSLAFGMVPEDCKEDVMAFIRSKDMACSVYGSQFLLDAIYDQRDADYALKMLTKKDKRSWYNMLRCGTTITYEAWDDEFKKNQDWNHAWGAAPANLLPRKLLGVEPLKPGFSRMAIRPQQSVLEYVEGVIPTIRGAVGMKINNTAEKYRLFVKLPANTSADVVLPITRDKIQVTCNGKKISYKRIAAGAIDVGTTSSGVSFYEVTYL